MISNARPQTSSARLSDRTAAKAFANLRIAKTWIVQAAECALLLIWISILETKSIENEARNWPITIGELPNGQSTEVPSTLPCLLLRSLYSPLLPQVPLLDRLLLKFSAKVHKILLLALLKVPNGRWFSTVCGRALPVELHSEFWLEILTRKSSDWLFNYCSWSRTIGKRFIERFMRIK